MGRGLDKYHDLVYRISLRILCDKLDAEEVSEYILESLMMRDYQNTLSQDVEDMILKRTCAFCKMRLVSRKIKYLLGEPMHVFVKAIPEADNLDDYMVKRAWQLFCRASFKMSPLQSVVYSLVELDDISMERVAIILGINKLRVKIALSRASKMVHNELSFYDCGDKYSAFVNFIRSFR